MNKTNKMTTIIILTVAIIVLLLSVVFFPTFFFSKAQKNEVNANTERELLARDVSDIDSLVWHFEGVVDNARAFLKGLAEREAGKLYSEERVEGVLASDNSPVTFNPAAVGDGAYKYVKPSLTVQNSLDEYVAANDLLNIYLVENGMYLIGGENNTVADVAGKSFYKSALNGRNTVSAFALALLDDFAFSVSVPVTYNEQIIGVAVLAYDYEAIGALISDAEKDSFSFVVSEGKVLTNDSLYSAALKAESGEKIYGKLYEFEAEAKSYIAVDNEIKSESITFDGSWKSFYVASADTFNQYRNETLQRIGLMGLISFVGFALPIGVVLALLFLHIMRDKRNLYRYRTILESFQKYSFIYDDEKKEAEFSTNSQKFFHMSKSLYTVDEMIRKMHFTAELFEKVEEKIPSLEDGGIYTVVFESQFADRPKMNLKVSLARAPRDELIKYAGYVGLIEDVTKEVQAKEELVKLATTDSLTRLLKHDAMQNKVDEYIEDNKENNEIDALYIVDIDGFKQINETYGHAVGDEIIKKVARAVSTAFENPDSAIIGRMSGDVFCIYVKNLPEAVDVARIAKLLCDRISLVPISENNDVYITCSMGVAVYPNHAKDFATLYQRADNALYKSKEFIGCVYTVYNSDENHSQANDDAQSKAPAEKDELSDLLSSDVNGFDKLRSLLIESMDNNEFIIYTQPKVSVNPRIGLQAEALARWDSPKYGKVMPNKFIPLLEKTNLIEQFDLCILRQAFREISKRINAKARYVIPISVNQTLNTVLNPYYISEVESIVKKYNVPTNMVTIELTEKGLVAKVRLLKKVFAQLHEMGFPLAIDDFGSGFTALSVLKELPIDELKIDRNFTDRNNNNDDRSKIIMKQLIQMAKELDMITVAEGVEYKEQAKYLAEFGCDFIQGYYVGRPMPIEELYDKFMLGIFSIRTLI